MRNRGLWILVALSAGCGGSVSGTTDTAPAKPYEGYVAIDVYDVEAAFVPTGSISVAPDMSVASMCGEPMTLSGQCCYSENVLDPPTIRMGVSAGALRVWEKSGSTGLLMPDSTGQYATADMAPTWGHDGDLLDFSASGDVVHPFAGTIQTPSSLVSTPGTQGNIVVDRSHDFVTTWKPDVHPGETVGSFTVFGGPQVINCMASDSAGSLTIPADLLARVDAGREVITNLRRQAMSTMTTDNATVYVTASTLITWNGTTQ